jgi:pimeloyl-ACP methyl ester carboxylesterase
MRRLLGSASWLGVLIAGGMAMGQGAPPASKGLVGPWAGPLKVAPGVELRIELKVKASEDGKSLTANFISPDQSPEPIAVDSITLEGKSVRFDIKKLNGSYAGELDPEARKIRGHWTQNGRAMDLDLAADDGKSARPEPPVELFGLWVGPLDLGAAKLRIVLRIEKGPDGRRVAYLDSPDQGAKGIPVTSIGLDGKTVKFACTSIGGSFQGTLDAEKGTITGTFKQLGKSTPLTLKKSEKVEEPKRSQVVKPPFPYRAEEVTFTNPEGGFSLAGTLTLPEKEGDGPYPAVVLITGSGPQDRDENLLGHKPFLVLADYLTRRGIAVLRADDRGVGGSQGPTVTDSTSEELATDTLAAIAFLKSDPRIDSKRIGLIGHSEGGVIAPMVAMKAPEDVAFAVLLAGTGVPGDVLLIEQNQRILRASGVSSVLLATNRVALTVMIAAAKAGKDPGPDDAKAAAASLSNALAGPLGGRWFRYFLTYDPRPALRTLRCPVLVLNGEKDLQVPPDQNLPEIEKALHEAGNTDVTIVELPGLNHLFQTATTGSPSEYAEIEETINPVVLEKTADWLRTRAHIAP